MMARPKVESSKLQLTLEVSHGDDLFHWNFHTYDSSDAMVIEFESIGKDDGSFVWEEFPTSALPTLIRFFEQVLSRRAAYQSVKAAE
jgi:hypothetical protein